MATNSSQVWLLGVCHRTAAAEVRERVAYDDTARASLLHSIRRTAPDVEAFVLSTCNRTEVYLAGPEGRDVAAVFGEAHRRSGPDTRDREELLRRHVTKGDDAVRHLVRVACGLESAVLADAQVIGQLRHAVGLAGEAGTMGPWLNRAAGLALNAGRRARRDTAFGRRGSGIGIAIAETVGEHVAAHAIDEPSVLVVGTGHVGAATAHALNLRHQVRLLLANRTESSAERVAAHTGGEVVPWRGWIDHLTRIDIAVCAVTTDEPILGAEEVRAAAQRGRLSLVVDAGLPRNVDPRAGSIVVPIDRLGATAAPDVLAAVADVDAIVDQALSDWSRWRSTRQVDAHVRALYSRTDDTIASIVRELAARTPLDLADAERTVRRRVRALVDGHVRDLRSYAFQRVEAG